VSGVRVIRAVCSLSAAWLLAPLGCTGDGTAVSDSETDADDGAPPGSGSDAGSTGDSARPGTTSAGETGTAQTGDDAADGTADDDDDTGDDDDDDSPPSVVAATGQTECFDIGGNAIPCAGTGQDGEFQKGVPHPSPRFTDLGDGTVRDNFTGLIWLRHASCLGKVGWSEALSRSNTLANGDADCELSDGSAPGDWRLPNIRELMSLISVSVAYPALTEGHPFVEVRNEMYWTSTSRASGGDSAWTGSPFASGRFSSGTKSEDQWWVWPVRSDPDGGAPPLAVMATGQTECFDDDGTVIDCAGTGQDGEVQAGVPMPSPRFSDPGDGTVIDNFTGLVWLKQSDCLGENGYEEAYSASAALADGSCGLSDDSAPGDWRVPNYKELQSLFDLSRVEPQLSDGHPFTGIQNGLHWTSTSLASGPDGVWKMNVFWSNIHGGGKDNAHYTWPVRDP